MTDVCDLISPEDYLMDTLDMVAEGEIDHAVLREIMLQRAHGAERINELVASAYHANNEFKDMMDRARR